LEKRPGSTTIMLIRAREMQAGAGRVLATVATRMVVHVWGFEGALTFRGGLVNELQDVLKSS
jgi:hypothetical protein